MFELNQEEFEYLRSQIDTSSWGEINTNNRTIYRVYFGRYTDKDKASATQKDSRAKGWDGFVKQIGND